MPYTLPVAHIARSDARSPTTCATAQVRARRAGFGTWLRHAANESQRPDRVESVMGPSLQGNRRNTPNAMSHTDQAM
jgi:hypothetical protein